MLGRPRRGRLSHGRPGTPISLATRLFAVLREADNQSDGVATSEPVPSVQRSVKKSGDSHGRVIEDPYEVVDLRRAAAMRFRRPGDVTIPTLRQRAANH